MESITNPKIKKEFDKMKTIYWNENMENGQVVKSSIFCVIIICCCILTQSVTEND